MNISERLAALTTNPHNISGGGLSPISLHDFTRARFEQEGATADGDALNPYTVGTMAHGAWDDGANFQLGVSLYLRGAKCPHHDGGESGLFHGWQSAMVTA